MQDARKIDGIEVLRCRSLMDGLNAVTNENLLQIRHLYNIGLPKTKRVFAFHPFNGVGKDEVQQKLEEKLAETATGMDAVAAFYYDVSKYHLDFFGRTVYEHHSARVVFLGEEQERFENFKVSALGKTYDVQRTIARLRGEQDFSETQPAHSVTLPEHRNGL